MQFGCVFQEKEPPNPSSFHGRTQNFGEQCAACNSQQGTSRHVTIREREGSSQGVTQRSDPHERSPCAPKFEDRTEVEILKKERSPTETRVKWQNYFPTQRKGQSYVPLTFGCLVSTSAILNEIRGKFICCGFWSLNAHAEQERSEPRRTVNRSSIQKPNNGHYSQ